MNLPNKLTLLRIAMVPPFVWFLLWGSSRTAMLVALVLFVTASLTDLLDGKIARKHNLVTNFGKLMDPLADKILVMAAMLCLVELRYAPTWVVILILSREFLVTSVRLIAAGEGVVIAADKWGKLKTVTQMAWVITALVALCNQPIFAASPAIATVQPMLLLLMQGLMWVSVFFTLLSGYNYVIKNKGLLFTDI